MKTMQQLYENKKLTINDLYEVKNDLKQKIDIKQNQLINSAKQLSPFTKESGIFHMSEKRYSPLNFITGALRHKGKAISLVEGILIGYKIMRKTRKFLKK